MREKLEAQITRLRRLEYSGGPLALECMDGEVCRATDCYSRGEERPCLDCRRRNALSAIVDELALLSSHEERWEFEPTDEHEDFVPYNADVTACSPEWPPENVTVAYERKDGQAFAHSYRLASHEEREPEVGWGPIASIVEDGYDVGESSEAIARAVQAYVVEGAPNPFKEEADRMWEARRSPPPVQPTTEPEPTP